MTEIYMLKIDEHGLEISLHYMNFPPFVIPEISIKLTFYHFVEGLNSCSTFDLGV